MENGRAPSRENDCVAFVRSIGRWPAGTTGAALVDHGPSKLVEVSDDRGQTLDLLEVANKDLELSSKHSPPFPDELDGLPGEAHLDDLVALTENIEFELSGTTGTVVADLGESKRIEVRCQGQVVTILTVPADKLMRLRDGSH